MSVGLSKILIVGGGSAGWMTASTLKKVYPNKEITLVESQNIKTVGVGESTLGQINNWLSLLEIKDHEFMKATDGSYKLGIRFQDFYKKNGGHFFYPFGDPDIRSTINGTNDWTFKKILEPETQLTDYADTFFPAMALINNNKMTNNEDGKLVNWNFQKDTAYHFDATKFGLFLKSNYCLNKGVKHIIGDITKIETDENGIKFVQINGSQEIKADLYIDCTGFNSLLLGGALKEPFESYEDILPNNKAIATKIPYRNKEKELTQYTNCVAHNNGWIWHIPLWSRIGMGYVYSDKYISEEEAEKEFKEYLVNNNYPIDDCKFNKINMRVGMHKRIFVKNVCAIGLSAGFIEPLESNGLYTVHEFLMKLLSVINRGQINKFDRDGFNWTTKIMFRNFAEFVSMHYAMSHRTDTKYWQDVQEREYCKDLINPKPTSYTGFVDFFHSKYHLFRFNESGGIHCVAIGMNYSPTDLESIGSHHLKYDSEFFKDGWYNSIKHLEKRKRHNNDLAKNYDKFYDFMKKHFYEE